MTKQLESLFDLTPMPNSFDTVSYSDDINNDEDNYTPEKLTNHKKVTEAIDRIVPDNLPKIQELLTLNEKDLDDLSKKSEYAYSELMELGMNVDIRYSSRLFEIAASMMKNAIDAKTAKIDSKLKSIDLQLKKLKIDRDSSEESDSMISGEGFIITDRNELLNHLLSGDQKDEKI